MGRGFRTTCRDWAAEETDYPREVIEAAQAHVVRNRVEAAYAGSDLFERRRALMDDWARYRAQGSLEDPEPLEHGGRGLVAMEEWVLSVAAGEAAAFAAPLEPPAKQSPDILRTGASPVPGPDVPAVEWRTCG